MEDVMKKSKYLKKLYNNKKILKNQGGEFITRSLFIEKHKKSYFIKYRSKASKLKIFHKRMTNRYFRLNKIELPNKSNSYKKLWDMNRKMY